MPARDSVDRVSIHASTRSAHTLSFGRPSPAVVTRINAAAERVDRKRPASASDHPYSCVSWLAASPPSPPPKPTNSTMMIDGDD